MIVSAVIDEKGRPICCEMWPGNTADVKTLIPMAERMRKRFGIRRFCLVADRGMISNDTVKELEEENIPYILGVRMRLVKKVRTEVLSRGGRYTEVYPEGTRSKDPSPLKVKQVLLDDSRYIVCVNSRQARKDTADREAIIWSLKEQLKKGAKSLVGNKGFRRYLKIAKDSARINTDKVKEEARYDGKWVLSTNDVKTLLETRPIFHQRDENIRGHVFEWSDIKQDLKALKTVTIEEEGKRFAIRTACRGNCGKIFQAVSVALPPAIREIT